MNTFKSIGYRVIAIFLFSMQLSLAHCSVDGSEPSGGSIFIDTILVRPLMAVTTVAGAGLFIISLPFSAIGKNTKEASEILVEEPFKYTFVRELGCF